MYEKTAMERRRRGCGIQVSLGKERYEDGANEFAGET